MERSEMVVVGTAQPPRGMSGLVRRVAKRYPEHWPRHWLLLLFADRVDTVESFFGRLLRRRPGATAAAVLMGIFALRRAAR